MQIKYKDIEQQLSADPQEAWLLLNQFFNEMIPEFEIARKLWLNIDVKQLAKDMNGIVAFSGDGVSLFAPKSKLTDNDALLLWLVSYYLGHQLGLVDGESLSKDELQTKLGKSGKITSTRLGEASKEQFCSEDD